MKIETFTDLLIEQVKDMYYAENKITKALPKMEKKATDPKLKQGFAKHLKETEDKISKLEKVFELLGVPAKGEKCPAIEGLIKEAEELISNTKDPEVLDAALILAAQKVEHYEMATYGSLCAFASQLGLDDVAKLLHQILEQEKKTDESLSKLAEGMSGINMRAKAA